MTADPSPRRAGTPVVLTIETPSLGDGSYLAHDVVAVDDDLAGNADAAGPALAHH